MKVKLLRRVFCVVMCVVILACSNVCVFAADLYNRNYKWIDSGTDYARVQWVNISFPSHSYGAGVLHGRIQAGTQMWDNGTAVENINFGFKSNEISYEEWMYLSSGWIAHSLPSENYWDTLMTTLVGTQIIYAISEAYNSDGLSIRDNYSNPTTSEVIKYSYIYYNPDHNESYIDDDVSNWNSIVAHEIGHSIGFGHYNGSQTSIMVWNIVNYNYGCIFAVDKECFYAKY